MLLKTAERIAQRSSCSLPLHRHALSLSFSLSSSRSCCEHRNYFQCLVNLKKLRASAIRPSAHSQQQHPTTILQMDLEIKFVSQLLWHHSCCSGSSSLLSLSWTRTAVVTRMCGHRPSLIISSYMIACVCVWVLCVHRASGCSNFGHSFHSIYRLQQTYPKNPLNFLLFFVSAIATYATQHRYSERTLCTT